MLFSFFSRLSHSIEENITEISSVNFNFTKHTYKNSTIFTSGNIKIGKCNPISEMEGPNGTCICNKNYFHDEPMSERGCWACHPTCGANMICDYPGVCKCKKGFYYAGFTHCARAIPNVESYFPPFGPISTNINISLKSLANFTASEISCKFNNTISPGIILTQNLVQCSVPMFKITSKKELVQIYLSYDNSTWSKQDIQFQILNPRKEINVTVFYIIAVVIIIIAAFFAMKYFNFPKFGGNKGSGDDQPLLHSNENY